MSVQRLAAAATRNWRKLKDAVWPRSLFCLCCKCRSEGALSCADCREELDALRLEGESAGQGSTRSIWRYAGVAKNLVLMLKLECVEDAAEVLADDMAEAIRSMGVPAETVLTWVTMPPGRLRERAIDHGSVLCHAVAKRCGLQARQLLERHGKVHTQRGLNWEKRLTNLSHSIRCSVRIDAPVILIDDVLTTGATAAACTEALLKAGASSVTALTATRVI